MANGGTRAMKMVLSFVTSLTISVLKGVSGCLIISANTPMSAFRVYSVERQSTRRKALTMNVNGHHPIPNGAVNRVALRLDISDGSFSGFGSHRMNVVRLS